MLAYSGEGLTQGQTSALGIFVILVAAACFLIVAFWKR
jgi:hypothetical protein